jgi:hypothetical protein
LTLKTIWPGLPGRARPLVTGSLKNVSWRRNPRGAATSWSCMLCAKRVRMSIRRPLAAQSVKLAVRMFS